MGESEKFENLFDSLSCFWTVLMDIDEWLILFKPLESKKRTVKA